MTETIRNIEAFVENNHLKLFLIIFLSYASLQLYHLDYRWVDDESWYLMPINSIWEGYFRIPTVPGDDIFWPQPPLLTYLQAFFSKVIPLEAYTARLIPFSFSCILIWAVYRFTKTHFGSLPAIFAAIFVSTDNILFITGRTVRPDIMIAAFQMLSILFFLKYVDKSRDRYLWLASLSAALAVSSHPNGLVIPVSIGILSLTLLNSWKDRFKAISHSAIAFIIFITPFIFWLFWMDRDSGFENVISHWTGRHGRFSNATDEMSFFAKNWALISAEINGRYSDFIQWPFRVHIGIAAVCAIVASFFYRNKLVISIGLIIASHLMFFIFVNNSNNSVRYLASALPLLAILYAVFTSEITKVKGWSGGQKLGALLLTLMIIGGSQFAGNLLFHWKFRSANYNAVIQELRSEIPPNSTVYGSMSFWLGLRDTLFVPYMRTNWETAENTYKPEYVIMDDRVMMGGWQSGEWKPLREELLRSMNTQGQLIKEVNNKFYGKLKLYKVNYD